MRPSVSIVACALACTLSPAAQLSAQQTPPPSIYASQVISFDSKGDAGGGIFNPSNALGAPAGGANLVHSLGIGGQITLGFDVLIANGPGADFIVSENPFTYPTVEMSFAEMMFVEVSSNGLDFARFPNAYTGPQVDHGAFGTVWVGSYAGMAGQTPVRAGSVNFPNADHQDVVEAGGDAFDLQDLSDHPLVLSGKVQVNAITQLRLVDVVSGQSSDSRNFLIYDPGAGSADVDAVTVIHYLSNIDGHEPIIELTIPLNGRFELKIDDPDGWQDLDPQSLQASVHGHPVPVWPLLFLMNLTRQDASGFTLVLPFDLPQPWLMQLAFSVQDMAGHHSGASRTFPDGN